MVVVAALVEAVCQRRSRRLVDYSEHFESGYSARVFGRLALRVGEVCGYGDDRLRHRLSDIRLRVLFELGQDHCGDLLRRIVGAVDLHFLIGAHISLYGAYRIFGIGDSLTLCHLPDETLSVLGKSDDGRSRSRTFRVCYDRGFAALENGDARVRGTEVYAYDFAHCLYSSEN